MSIVGVRSIASTGLLAIALLAIVIGLLAAVGLITWSIRAPLPAAALWGGLAFVISGAAIAAASFFLAMRLRPSSTAASRR